MRLTFKSILISLILMFIFPTIAFAFDMYVPDEALQGNTLELQVSEDDIVDINGTFDGKNLKFFEILKAPNWDEKISRAEFLQLMFENYDFGDIDLNEAVEFPDVQSDHPYYEYIQKASALDIIHGYEDGYFRPYTPITRGQISKILVRAFDPSETSSPDEIKSYEDVPEEHRFYEYIQRSVQAGYFKGYPDGLMRPDRNINYDEAGIVIKRAANPEVFVANPEKQYLRAFIGVHRLSTPGIKALIVNATNSNNEIKEESKEIEVLEREFPVQSFTLPESKTELLSKENQDNTWTVINKAKETTSEDKLWDGPFIVPTTGTITLTFGDKTYINGVFSGSHFGVDYANEEGTEIYASNSGIVTLAEETMSYGNTIIIDHGHNVFTMYLHMSELKVEKGQTVSKGELIGLMGATGVATGSHLHFNHFVGDVIVDSAEWINDKF